jgi:cell wall-associated NlpC family hydrolase
MRYLLIPFAMLVAFSVNAQKSSNSGPKFIENIEFTPSGNGQPQATGNTQVSNDKKQESGDKKQGSSNKNPVTSNSQITTDNSQIESFSRLQFKYAQLLDVEVESITNANLYNFINDWYGAAYQLGGNTRSGIDCSGFACTLTQKIYKINLPRTAKEQYEVCDHVAKDQLREGDLVFFNTFGGVSHVGVYLANGHFVHASTNYGVIISSLAEGYYSQKFIGGGRINAGK